MFVAASGRCGGCPLLPSPKSSLLLFVVAAERKFVNVVYFPSVSMNGYYCLS